MPNPSRICSIDDCHKPTTKGQLICSMHRSRRARERLKKEGPKRLCSIESCDRPHYVHGWCEVHSRRAKKYGDPLYEWDPTAYRKPGTSYRLAHERLKAAKGSASEHECADCGRQAEDWSYNGSAPDEMRDEKNRPFSADFNFYSPRCKTCHRHMDWVKPACKRGHQFDEANTYLTSDGKKVCRTCSRNNQREYQRRKRESAA